MSLSSIDRQSPIELAKAVDADLVAIPVSHEACLSGCFLDLPSGTRRLHIDCKVAVIILYRFTLKMSQCVKVRDVSCPVC